MKLELYKPYESHVYGGPTWNDEPDIEMPCPNCGYNFRLYLKPTKEKSMTKQEQAQAALLEAIDSDIEHLEDAYQKEKEPDTRSIDYEFGCLELTIGDLKKIREYVAARDDGVLDTGRMNWLCQQHVEVRTPLRWGSYANFHAYPDIEGYDSELRERIDSQLLSFPKALSGGEEE